MKASLNAVIKPSAHHILHIYADDRGIRCTYTSEAILLSANLIIPFKVQPLKALSRDICGYLEGY
jgi:hypothetical protein